MARRPRKTTLERLQEELDEVQSSIDASSSSLKNLKEKEQELQEAITAEKTKQVLEILKERDMTVDDLVTMLDVGAQETA